MTEAQAQAMLDAIGDIREDIGAIKARLDALEAPGRRAGAMGAGTAALLVGLIEAVKAMVHK